MADIRLVQSGRRSASPGRPGPPPRAEALLHRANIDPDDECLVPCPLDRLSELRRDSFAHCEGRIVYIGGCTFYSPNSTANVSVPERFPEGKFNVFKRTRGMLKDFQSPLWYDKRHRCLPFIPSVAFYDDLMCAPLRRRLELEEEFERDGEGRWYVPADVVEEWMDLERQTCWLITWLEAYNRPYQRSLRLPSDVGLQRKFSSVRHAVYFMRRTKDWFMLLFAYATWLLSDNNIFSDANREDTILWKHLIEHKVNENFLRSFVSSTILCISTQVPRVGCFFDLASFLYHSIPVWIELNEETWKLLKSAELHKFRPPSKLLREFDEERRSLTVSRGPLFKDPSAVDAWRRSVAQNAEPTSHVQWREFFIHREQLNRDRMNEEGPRERQRREDREKYSRSGWSGTAAYFKWIPDVNGGGRIRTRLSKDNVRVEMIRHAPTQRRFDPFANEWDICTEFGSLGDYDRRNLCYEEGDSDEESDDMDDSGLTMGYPGPYSLPAEVVQDSPDSPPPTPDRDPGFANTVHLTRSMGARIPLLFGLSLQHIATTIQSPSSMHLKHLYRALGGERQDDPLPDVPVNGLLYLFFSSMIGTSAWGSGPSASIPNFDLDPLWPELRDTIRSAVVRGDGLFLVKPASPSCTSIIVVYRPEAALFCCRLEERGLDETALALYQHGIRFNVCISSSEAPAPPSSEFIFSVVPPVVSADAEVDRAVYQRFLVSRRLFLVGHRRRAALLYGGLVARIAKDIIGSNAECERLVLQEPSPNVLSCADNIVGEVGDGSLLYDDVLAPYEVDYILGAHLHRKGAAKDYRYNVESWWPRGSVLASDVTNVYHWYWDDHNEHWYSRRAVALDSVEVFPAPKSTAKWKKDSHVSGPVRDFYRGYRDLCDRVLFETLP